MTKSPSIEEFAALQEALDAAIQHAQILADQNHALAGHRLSLQGENRVLRAERDLLKERLAKMMHKVFAAKSEARGTDQKDMFFNEAEGLAGATPAQQESVSDDAASTHVAGYKRAPKRGRKPLDPALPRHVVRHELSAADLVCPHDGAVLKEIGVEASEQLDIIPQQVRVIRHERVKYACPCCDAALRLAAKPVQIIPKGLFTEAALAWVVSAKFDDGLPLYRQAALLARFGGTDLSRSTMAASMVKKFKSNLASYSLAMACSASALVAPRKMVSSNCIRSRWARCISGVMPSAARMASTIPLSVMNSLGWKR